MLYVQKAQVDKFRKELSMSIVFSNITHFNLKPDIYGHTSGYLNNKG